MVCGLRWYKVTPFTSCFIFFTLFCCIQVIDALLIFFVLCLFVFCAMETRFHLSCDFYGQWKWQWNFKLWISGLSTELKKPFLKKAKCLQHHKKSRVHFDFLQVWEVWILHPSPLTLCPGYPGSPDTPDSPGLPEFPWISQTRNKSQWWSTNTVTKNLKSKCCCHSPPDLGSLYVLDILWVPAGRPHPEHNKHTIFTTQ